LAVEDLAKLLLKELIEDRPGRHTLSSPASRLSLAR
jgi:hypothetical protein